MKPLNFKAKEENFGKTGCIILERDITPVLRKLIYDNIKHVFLANFKFVDFECIQTAFANFNDDCDIYIKWETHENQIDLWISQNPENYVINTIEHYLDIENSDSRNLFHSMKFNI